MTLARNEKAQPFVPTDDRAGARPRLITTLAKFVKIRTILLFALISSAPVCNGDNSAPPTEHIGSSLDGRFIVRLSSKIQVFVLEREEKSYRLVSEFDPASERTPLKALISDDGRFVVTLDGGRGMGRGRDVVAVYDCGGKKLMDWRLDQILQKEDLASVISSVGSDWWRQDVRIAYKPPTLIVVGPSEQFGLPKHRYWYQLDLETLKWTKKR